MITPKRLASLLATLLLATPLTAAKAPAPTPVRSMMAGYEFYVTIEGTKQGKFKGESAREKYKEKIPAIGFQYEVSSPRDLATGQASGKRQHKPITFTKDWGPASPQLFQALTTNEVLKKVTFEFIKTTAEGAEEVFHTITLTNATISNIKQYIAAGSAEGGARRPADVRQLEDVSLTFQKIDMENKEGKTMAADDWSKPQQ